MTEILRFTSEAMGTLVNLAQEKPDLWTSQKGLLEAELHKLGLDNYTEPASLHATKQPDMPSAADLPGNRKALADMDALKFSRNIQGLTARDLSDPGLLTWLSCFPLYRFGAGRWPIRGASSHKDWVLRHYIARTGHMDDITDGNLAGRTLWLAETARRAAAASGGAFTEQEALDHFCRNPEQYHAVTHFAILRNDLVLAEYVRAQRLLPRGLDSRGRKTAQAANLHAGATVIDALDRKTIRAIYQAEHDLLKADNAKRVINVLSLGAGVQSTVMALMADREDNEINARFGKPDLAIFADTGWEPRAVYDHLDWLETQLSYPVIRVSNGNIKESTTSGTNPEGRQFIDMPVYVVKPDGKQYIGTRQCTKQFKLKPIHRYLKENHSTAAKGKPVKDVLVRMWLGISRDEAHRQKPSRESWISNIHPLLDADISRVQLSDWFQRHYPDRTLPKSACIGCPYHSDAAWAAMKAGDPESWHDAVGVDWAIRNVAAAKGSIDGTAYLHRSRKPLNEVDFGAAGPENPDAFAEECEGMCGI